LLRCGLIEGGWEKASLCFFEDDFPMCPCLSGQKTHPGLRYLKKIKYFNVDELIEGIHGPKQPGEKVFSEI
jgi:hypothetical protein